MLGCFPHPHSTRLGLHMLLLPCLVDPSPARSYTHPWSLCPPSSLAFLLVEARPAWVTASRAFPFFLPWQAHLCHLHRSFPNEVWAAHFDYLYRTFPCLARVAQRARGDPDPPVLSHQDPFLQSWRHRGPQMAFWIASSPALLWWVYKNWWLSDFLDSHLSPYSSVRVLWL